MSRKSGRRYLVGLLFGALCFAFGVGLLSTKAGASSSGTVHAADTTTTAPPDLQFNVVANQLSCAADNSGQGEFLYNVTLASGTVDSNESGTVTVSFSASGQTPVTDTFPLNDLAPSNGGHHTHTVTLGSGFDGQTVTVVASISTPVTGYGSTNVDDTCTAPVTTTTEPPTTVPTSTTTTVPSTTTTTPGPPPTAPPDTSTSTTVHTTLPPSHGSGSGHGSSGGSSGTLGPKVVTDYVGGHSNSGLWFISLMLITIGLASTSLCGTKLLYARRNR